MVLASLFGGYKGYLGGLAERQAAAALKGK
jgi:hypothetical protein